MKLSFLLKDLVNDPIYEEDIRNVCLEPQKCEKHDILFLMNEKAVSDYTRLLPHAAAVITCIPLQRASNTQIFTTQNIRDTLSKICARMYCKGLSKIKFIGITGTNGKSTTAILLERILSDSGHKVGYIGTGIIRFGDKILSEKYYSMTTPPPNMLFKSIGKMEEMGAEIIIMEVSSHALDQSRVSPINFDIGIFTNLSEEHLDYHKSMSEYFNAKKKLLEKSKIKIVNSDDHYGRSILYEYENVDGCGTTFFKNVRIDILNSSGLCGNKFRYKSDTNEEDIELKLAGTYNIYNAALAIRAAERLGIPLSKAKKALEETQKIDGRFNLIDNNIKIIIDYAHTVSAFDNLLKNLYSIKKQGQNLTLVFGCGGDRDKSKRGKMGLIAEKYADKIIVTSDNPRGENPLSIIEEILKPMKSKPMIIENREEAIREAIFSAADGDIVAIVGKGPEDYIISRGELSPFNEKEIIEIALKERLN